MSQWSILVHLTQSRARKLTDSNADYDSVLASWSELCFGDSGESDQIPSLNGVIQVVT